MTYRVTYPLITQDAHRDFATSKEAEAFAQERRAICDSSPYHTINSWRHVKVEEVGA